MSRIEKMREQMRAKSSGIDPSTPGSPPPSEQQQPLRFAGGDEAQESLPGASELDMETDSEIKQSEKLASTLKSKRKKTKDELGMDGGDEDVAKMMKEAKRKTKQRLLDESSIDDTTSPVGGESPDGGGSPLASGRVAGLSLPLDASMTGGTGGGAEGLDETARSARPPRGTTPRNTTQALSLREKLTAKLRAAMDQGQQEAMKESKESNQKLAGKRTEQRSTRFDEFRTDDHEPDELEKSLRLKVSEKWKDQIKDIMDAKKKEEALPTQEEAYDFFIRVWDEKDLAAEQKAKEEEMKKKEKKKKPGTATTDDTTTPPAPPTDEGTTEAQPTDQTVPEEERKLLPDEDFEDNSWMLYQIGRGDYMPQQYRLDAEDKLYFVPSMAETPARTTILATGPPRNLEDEGFYVGNRPYVPDRNLHRMENRLLKEIGNARDEEGAIDNSRNAANIRKWFGEDRRLITLPDPVKQVSSRPTIVDEYDSPLLTPYIKANVVEEKVKFVGGHYQLDIDVNTLVFTHHHMFSLEHVRASQLVRMSEEYSARQRKNTLQFLSGKLQALKSAKLHIEENIRSLEGDETKQRTVNEQRQMLRVYKSDISSTRKARDVEMEAERTLTKNIIRTWKEIKSLRQTQGCTNTPVKLQIRKEPANVTADQEEWNRELREELEELQEDLADQYNKSMEEYNKQLQLWKEQRLRKKEARKRQKANNQATDENADHAAQAKKDADILNELDLIKPDKPKPETDAQARDRIDEKYKKIRRLPGEPKLYLELTNNASITATQDCPRGEQQRRNDLNKYRIFVEVLFNDKEVYKTTLQPLGQDFTVRFAQIFNIEILYWPESIQLQVYETYGMTTERLSTVYAAIPESNVTASSSPLTEINFSSDLKRLHQNTACTGSGEPIALDLNRTNVVSLMTSGVLTASVVWATDATGKVLVPPSGERKHQMYSAMKGMDAITAIGMSGLGDVAKISKWIEESHLDPNDPSNAEIMHLMKPVSSGGVTVASTVLPDHFRLEHIQEEFNLATEEDLESSKRFRLIQYRDQGIEGFKNIYVPAFDREVDDKLLMQYDMKKRAEQKLRETDDTDSHHVAVAKYMQKVRLQIMMNFSRMQRSYKYNDIVVEEAIPNIGVIMPKLLDLVRPRRDLKPVREQRKKVTAQNLQSMEVKILVNIIRAFGIPIRSGVDETHTMPGMSRTLSGGDALAGPSGASLRQNTTQESIVRPFIEVMFQRHVIKTSVAEGNNPCWNEEICIPFRAPNDDYSSTNLQTVNDLLYLNLFDEYIVDINQDTNERTTTVHHRVERRWLGSIKIPFSTIYTNGRIDGTFRVGKPQVLLGYTYENHVVGAARQKDGGIKDTDHTYLSMFITIDPPLNTPEGLLGSKFDSMEDDALRLATEVWEEQLLAAYPKRDYTTLIVNLEGISVLVTRYISPINPPAELIKTDPVATMEMVARYVSFIPSVSDTVVFPGFCDIWATSNQFLQMLQGDEEEHAVLLTNYFLHLGKKAWLLIGSGIPEGSSAYVMTQEGNEIWIWNATTGEHYDYRDNYCPLQSVGCLVSSTNILANIQANDKPNHMSFDLNNTAHWKPFFTKDNPNPGLASIQVDRIQYQPADKVAALALQEKIESELKKRISEWRKRHITRWNRYCIQTFRRLLVQLEECSEKGVQYQHTEELDHVLKSYKLSGFPLNLTYTEMAPLVDAVYATGVHEFESSDVEFALAVHIQPYANNVLSVWIYVASLILHRRT